jgi:superfamily II RNA helicase
MSVIHQDSSYNGSLNFNQYPFPLSDFQKHTIQAWHDGKNSVVCAHTGSGKTLPAENIMNHVIDNKLGKVIFTTPIKSLSNDKFGDLQKKVPNGDIGILTGDIKFNPNGNILIMTTEILRNLLYNGKIEDVKNKVTISIDIDEINTVVFDEVHYMGDEHRGMVWEECFILLPERIRLINLSATIENPDHFAQWLADIKNTDVVLTKTSNRVVPLRHSLYLDYLPSFLNKDKMGDKCRNWHDKPIIFSDENNAFDTDVYTDTLNHIKKSSKGLSRNQVINNLIEYLDLSMLKPAIFFSFSRKGCEKLAHSVSHNLLRETEPSLVDKLVHDYLRKTDNYQSYIHMEQFYDLKKCLDKGIAYHHSGLLPIFKEVVEMLFGYKDHDGSHHPLVKILFATETFAVGVNMPTKTVVFTSVEKYTNGEKRYLHTHEYLQMAGRAGRRGIDKTGLVILLPNLRNIPLPHVMKNMIIGSGQVIKSKFRPNYKIIMKSIMNGNPLDNIVKKSMIDKEVSSDLKYYKEQLKTIDLPELDVSQCVEYETIKTNNYGFIKPSKKTQKDNLKKIKEWEKDADFMKLYKQYTVNKKTYEKKDRLNQDIRNCSDFLPYQVETVTKRLREAGYMENESVTQKGVIASEINECNEILLTEMIVNNCFEDMNFKEIGTVLSLFGDSRVVYDKNKEEPYIDHIYNQHKFKEVIRFTEDKLTDWQNFENSNHLYINSEWEINKAGMDATYEWLDGGNFNNISKKYNIYEGNLIKDFLKIYNLAANLVSISKLINNPKLEIESEKLMDNVMRDVVSVESLHVR